MSLAFYKVSSAQQAAQYLANNLSKRLKNGQKVLWLLPGGSSIEVAVKASRLLRGNTANLVVTLSDERFGPVGHPDSNWQQLKQAGFDFAASRQLPVLVGEGLQKTADLYSDTLRQAIEETDYHLGFFGVGADAHIAGIKPGSPAVRSENLAEGYEWDDFTRLTITPKVFKELDEAVVYMRGKEKWPVIDRIGKSEDIASEPVQILSRVAKVSIYNDSKGEEI